MTGQSVCQSKPTSEGRGRALWHVTVTEPVGACVRFAELLAAELLRVTPRPKRPWSLGVRDSGAIPAASPYTHSCVHLGSACCVLFAFLFSFPTREGRGCCPQFTGEETEAQSGGGGGGGRTKVTPPLEGEAPDLVPPPAGFRV